VNIDIGNRDWLDVEEKVEMWGGDDPYADDTDEGVRNEATS
jgi:hypothetical protein